MEKFLILIQCRDRVGIVSDISGVLATHELNIVVMREFVDTEHVQFFARIECTGEDKDHSFLEEELRKTLGKEVHISVCSPESNKKVAVLVTREYHCLGDILVRNFFGLLGADVCCVIGNHNVLESFTNRFSIPFHHISHENKLKEMC